jgi:hypothetical protein
MEFWQDFVYLLTNNEVFRSGFIWGVMVVVGGWLFGRWVLFPIYAHWLEMRKFFEPTKQPGKLPTEKGPSPAGMLFGCLWPIALLVVAIALGYVFWSGGVPGR